MAYVAPSGHIYDISGPHASDYANNDAGIINHTIAQAVENNDEVLIYLYILYKYILRCSTPRYNV